MKKINQQLILLAQLREEFVLMENYSELLSLLGTIQVLSLMSEKSMLVLLLPPFLLLVFKPIRTYVMYKTNLAKILEPFFTTWLFTSMVFPSFFTTSKVLGIELENQSLASFFVIFFIIGNVIYQKKELKPIFFD